MVHVGSGGKTVEALLGKRDSDGDRPTAVVDVGVRACRSVPERHFPSRVPAGHGSIDRCACGERRREDECESTIHRGLPDVSPHGVRAAPA
jgi:hypothetical protein